MSEAFTDPHLLELLAGMAIDLTERYGWPHERATEVVFDYAAKARQHYRAEAPPLVMMSLASSAG